MKITLPEIFLSLVFLISFVSAIRLINNAGVINVDGVLLTEYDEEIGILKAALALRKQRSMVKTETTMIVPRTRTVDVNVETETTKILPRTRTVAVEERSQRRPKKNLLSRIAAKVRNENRRLRKKIRKKIRKIF